MLTLTIRNELSGEPTRGRALRLLTLGVAGVLGACAYTPPRPVQPVAASIPPPVTEVYFYPNKAQSAAQQDRDRYECYLWAVKQTGFDPSAPQAASHMRVRVVPGPPPGADIATGAAAGAVLGAAVSPPRHAPEGAVMGAIAGAAVGAASEAARQEQVERAQAHLDQREAARLERQAANYRRAMAACLEGRGYTVK